ncbi:hypothetical protein LR48_Vigan08g013600 [Vigna angularis]|uniref:Uncharacterized protein n=1 Tax=Phaseolus angularis TaxID=3914 RepID=A0A0L9V3I9_PHAAN|nr:hypothetical protein LR48_Vigan08g013600 [Vigna angularis]
MAGGSVTCMRGAAVEDRLMRVALGSADGGSRSWNYALRSPHLELRFMLAAVGSVFRGGCSWIYV